MNENVHELFGDDPYEPTLSEAQAYYAAQSVNGSEPVDSWVPQNLADLDDEPPVQPTLGGVGFVYPGKRHLFSGPQESAKTLAAYVIGLEVVRSGKPIVLVDFEMGPWDTKTRLRELGASMDELKQVAYVEPDERPTGAAIGRLVDLEPGVVILDAAAGAFQLSELDDNRRQDVERFAAAYVHPFRKAGIATIVLDHVVKDAKGRGNYAIGSERKAGGVDVHIGFEVIKAIKRGGDGAYKVVTHKDRGGFLKRGRLADFILSSDAATHRITWQFQAAAEATEEAPFRPTHLMEKVSRYLELQPEPVPRSDVEKDVEGKGKYIREALDLLVAESFASESRGLKNARLVRSEMAYREGEDQSHFSSSPVRPQFVPDPSNLSSSVRPSPYGGTSSDQFVPQDELSSSRGTFPSKDDIPF